MTISTTDYILEELRINNRLLQRVIELQKVQAYVSLGAARQQGHITEKAFNEMADVVEGKSTQG